MTITLVKDPATAEGRSALADCQRIVKSGVPVSTLLAILDALDADDPLAAMIEMRDAAADDRLRDALQIAVNALAEQQLAGVR